MFLHWSSAILPQQAMSNPTLLKHKEKILKQDMKMIEFLKVEMKKSLKETQEKHKTIIITTKDEENKRF